MPEWSTSCIDWEDRLIRRESIIPPPIYPEEAERALVIFKQLRVCDLPGKPTFGECCDQFVFDFVAVIFGAYDCETGNQLIREFFLLISKKNTKSTVAAGIMLTALILCWREEEEHLILAATKEIADNSFKPAAAMVRADEELSDMFQVQDHIRTITHRVTKNSLKVVAADTDTVSGKKSGKILIDEHWLFGTKHNAESMLMEATGGQVSRNEGWIIILTTQSDNPPAGVFKDKLLYYRQVRDGIIEDKRSLGILYEFPLSMIESKGYLKPENFYITNPNLGKSVSQEWLEANLKKTLNKTDGSLQVFLAKHLNIEIGLALRSDRWSGAEFWDDCADPNITLEYILKHCEVVDVGIDGGGLDDLLGFCVVGRFGDGEDHEAKTWLTWHHAWAHPSVLERRKEIAPALKDFEKEGTLTIVQNVGDDIDEVADMIELIDKAYLLDKVGVDPVGIADVLDALEARKIAKDKIIGVSQGWKLGGAIKTTERRLAKKSIRHAGSGLMKWCLGNARVEPRANSILITKQASGTAKIDPLMANLNANTLMAMNPPSMKQKYQMVIV